MAVYCIKNIQDNDTMESLRKALFSQEHVSHIKVYPHIMYFHTSFMNLLQPIFNEYQGLEVVEVVEGVASEYKFPKRKKRKRYFTIKDTSNNSQTQINQFVDKLYEDNRFSEIEYNENNRFLTLHTSEKDVLSILRTYLFSVNPYLIINEHHRKKKPRDYFSEKFMRRYVQIGIIIVSLSIALITNNDDTILPYVMWGITLLTLAYSTLKEAYDLMKIKKYFTTPTLFIIALIFTFASGQYLESLIAILIYKIIPSLDSMLISVVTNKIDTYVEINHTAIRVREGVEEEISLYDFVRGDVMKINPGGTVFIPGIIVEGSTMISSFSNDTSTDDEAVKELHHVFDGDVNTGKQPIYVMVDRAYEDTIYQTLQTLAIHAPTNESKIQKRIDKISMFVKPILFLFGIFIGVVLPIVNYRDYHSFIHVGGIIMIIAFQHPSEHASVLMTLSTLAKSFSKGIVVESAVAYNQMSISQTIVYDRVDNAPMNKYEWLLFKKLSHLGKHFIIFNDGPVDLEHPKYEIYNGYTLEQKKEKLSKLISPIVYIGDSNSDLELIQMSDVGISRGGLNDKKLVENSDIVLIDSRFKRIYQMFRFARKLRSMIIINSILDIVLKAVLLITVIAFPQTSLCVVMLIQLVYKSIIILSTLY